MEKFAHSPLDLDRPAVRLLRLLKGTEPSVECEIFQAYLDTTHDDLIPYEALSYTWGGTDMCASVQIDTKTHHVTENLYLALQHLRYEEEDRVLWVDAICIDQCNTTERSHQVEQMSIIYCMAHRVVIWLGPGTDETDTLLDSLKQLEKSSLRSWKLTDHRWSEMWSSLSLTGSRDRRCRAGLQALLARPWFKRVWILQEVAHARRATICCGTKSVSAHVFALAPRLVKVRRELHCQAVIDIMPGQSRKSSWWSESRDLYTLLRKFSNSQASDDRDKIYALLGICVGSKDSGKLRTDYAKSYDQLIHDTAIHLFDLPDRKEQYTMSDLIPCTISQDEGDLSTAVFSQNCNWVDAWLRNKKEAVNITPRELSSAALNKRWGADMVCLLIDHPSCTFVMSFEILSAIATKECSGRNILAFLHEKKGEDLLLWVAGSTTSAMNLILEKLGEDVEITPRVLEAAAENNKYGGSIMELLLHHQARGGPLSIPHEVIEAAARNSEYGPQIMTQLQKHLGDRIEITKPIVESLAQNRRRLETWTILLRIKGFNERLVTITDEALEALAMNRAEVLSEVRRSASRLVSNAGGKTQTRYPGFRSQRGYMPIREVGSSISRKEQEHDALKVWVLLMERLGGDINITPRVVEALTTNYECGIQVLRLLLGLRKVKHIFIDAAIVAAMQRSNCRHETGTLRLLLDYHGDYIARRSVEDSLPTTLVSIDSWKDSTQTFITSKLIQAIAMRPTAGHEFLACFCEQVLFKLKVTEAAVVLAQLVVEALEEALCWAGNIDPSGIKQYTQDMTSVCVNLAGRSERYDLNLELNWMQAPVEDKKRKIGLIDPALFAQWNSFHNSTKLDPDSGRGYPPYKEWKAFTERLRKVVRKQNERLAVPSK